MKRRLLLTFLFLLILFMPSHALAERPFLATETAIPIERKTYRLEGGLVFNRFSSDHKMTQLGFNLRYGLIQNLELSLGIPYLFIEDGNNDKSQQGDLLLKAKIRFIKGRAANPLSIAGQLIVKLPTAGEEKILQTTGVVDVGFLAIASKTFTPVTAHINFGYYSIGNPDFGNTSDQLRYNLGLALDVEGTPFKLISELVGQSDTSSSSVTDDTVVAMGGFSVRTREDLTLDTTVGFGLSENSPDYIINIGATYVFP